MRNAEFVHSLCFFAKLLCMMHKIRNDEKIPHSAFRIRKNPLKTTKDKFIQNCIFYFYIMSS